MNGETAFFAAWKDYYTIIGSAAAGLTGLVFVVMTLVAARRNSGVTGYGTSIFSSPTVVLFCAALFISGVCTAPWPSPGVAGTLIGLSGLAGVVYALRIGYRTTQLETYAADPADWIWFTVLPFVASLAVCISGFMLVHAPVPAAYALAGAAMALLFIGIHNAWDVITYMVIDAAEE